MKENLEEEESADNAVILMNIKHPAVPFFLVAGGFTHSPIVLQNCVFKTIIGLDSVLYWMECCCYRINFKSNYCLLGPNSRLATYLAHYINSIGCNILFNLFNE